MLRASRKRRLRSAFAFTLVEMLVVISIIAVLASLVLAGIQSVRGDARRITCSNNLRNLFFAVQHFEASKGNLPASRAFWNDPVYKASSSMPTSWTAASAPSQTLTWVHEVMPYIERQDLKTQVEGQLASGGSVQMVAGRLNLVLCPSHPIEEAFSVNSGTKQKYSPLSYAANGGVLDNTSMANPQYGFDWPQNGLFDNRLKGTTKNSPESQLKIYTSSLSQVANGDGCTNTILLVDNVYLEEWNFAPTEVHVCIVWDDLNYPKPLQSLSVNSNLDKPDSLLNLYNQGPNYVLPYARPASFHPGGFNVAFCDGRVKFVAQTIAYEVYMHLMTSSGRRYQPAGFKTLAPPPFPPALTSNAVQNVFQGALEEGSY